eukprot:scaffold72431_cov44-Attheya_sp.AAC.3
MFTPKKTAKRLLARVTDLSQEEIEDFKNNLTSPRITHTGSFDDALPPTTPKIGTVTTVGEFFDINDSLPSPPKGKEAGMLTRNVHEVLAIVYPDYEVLAQSDNTHDNEKYGKLVYAVGAGFFDQSLVNILRNPSPNMIEAELFVIRLVPEEISDKESPHCNMGIASMSCTANSMQTKESGLLKRTKHLHSPSRRTSNTWKNAAFQIFLTFESRIDMPLHACTNASMTRRTIPIWSPTIGNRIKEIVLHRHSS